MSSGIRYTTSLLSMDILTKYFLYNDVSLFPGWPSSHLHPYNKIVKAKKYTSIIFIWKYILQNLFSAMTDFIKVAWPPLLQLLWFLFKDTKRLQIQCEVTIMLKELSYGWFSYLELDITEKYCSIGFISIMVSATFFIWARNLESPST